MLTRVTCAACGAEQPLRPAWRDWSLPPTRLVCSVCERELETIFAYRVTWMESLLHKVFGVLSVPVALHLALALDVSLALRFAVALFGPVVLGGVGGFLASRILAFPAQLVLDRVRS